MLIFLRGPKTKSHVLEIPHAKIFFLLYGNSSPFLLVTPEKFTCYFFDTLESLCPEPCVKVGVMGGC